MLRLQHSKPLKNNLVYHYCDLATLEKILSSKVIWATEGSFLNDTKELHQARDLICNLLDRWPTNTALQKAPERIALALRKEIDDPVVHGFVASFSEDGDLLSQWRAYADNGCGVALGFEVTKFRRKGVDDSETPELLPCIYDANREVHELLLSPAINAVIEHVKRYGNEELDAAVRELQLNLRVIAYQLGLMLKAKGFREEREWRVAQFVWKPDLHKVVKFRNTRFGPAPYVEIPMPPRRLKRLGLGPRVHAVTERSFRMMLKKYKCDAEIYRSEVSYR